MKARHLFFLLLFISAAGCSPDASSNSSINFTNANAPYSKNVSGMYQLLSYGTVGTWRGIDIKWKDSSDYIRALSGYAGKAVLLSFWVTVPDTGAWEEPSLDSVQHDLGDSVGIVTVAEDDIYSNNFQSVYNYVTANKISVQVVVDSDQFADIAYSGLANGNLALPETFILKPNGTVLNYAIGYQPERVLDSLVRAAYH